MNGTIDVQSEPGSGSTFRVVLPLIRQNYLHCAPQLMPREYHGQRVLVMHHNHSARNMLIDHLATFNLNAEGTETLPVCISLLLQADRSHRPFSLVLLETAIPERDVAAFRSGTSGLSTASRPALALICPQHDCMDSEKMGHFGVSAILYKPICPSLLQPTLLKALAATTSGNIETGVDNTGIIKNASRILIAEDNPTTQTLLRSILENFGCQVDMASNGKEAVELLSHHELVLMDLRMPGMDGLEAARQIRLQGNNVPIIAMTAHGDKQGRTECLAAGMNDYLQKPFRNKQLQALVRHWLGECTATVPAPITVDIENLGPPGQRILVVEDTDATQRLIRIILEELGCQVAMADNGEEAVALLETTPFDLVFMDCQMPGIDGFEATRRIRDRNIQVPIIALTARCQEQHREAFQRAGMNDYLGKPFRRSQLEAMAKHWLTRDQGARPPVDHSASQQPSTWQRA
jgi:CheY-like chemotaxis protein/BarA-like signal transduction histidine kinase